MHNLRIDSATDLVPPPGCPICGSMMHLAGIEWKTEARDIYMFYCRPCDHHEIKRLELH